MEVTFDRRVTAKTAKQFVERSLDMDMNTAISDTGLICIAYSAKEAERVLQAELRNRIRASSGDNASLIYKLTVLGIMDRSSDTSITEQAKETMLEAAEALKLSRKS